LAIVQVSRITNRKGLADNLPQLAGAELGWATDTRRLYIGNGTLQDGAPVVGNTEVLTEFSNVLELGGAYIYQGAAAGYTVQTGSAPGTSVSQSLQSWMDQWASVTDFGAVGDGSTDDTDAINRALYQLFCREVNPQIRRSLFFPAGQYRVTGTIIVPSYARLYGEGAESSMIVLDSGSGDSYCVRYGDSLQQYGANIGNNGATPPVSIEIASMGFASAKTCDIALIQDANFCTFNDVAFEGPLTTANLTSDVENISCLRFDSTSGLITNNITFRRCRFGGTTWAVNTVNQLKGVTITESTFDTLYQGVLLGDPSPVNGGPSGFRIVNSVFDNIYLEGIKIIAGTSLNASGYNIFFDVGNHFNGYTSPVTSIIDFDNSNNISIGDLFQRTPQYAITYPCINLNNTASIAFEGAGQIKQGTYVRETGQRQSLTNNVTTQTVFTMDSVSTRAFRVDYTIVRDTATRTGTYTVVASTDGTGGTLTTNDTGYQNTSTGVTFTVTETGSLVTFAYSTTNTGLTGILHYSITHLA